MLVDMKTRGGPFKYKTFKDMLAKHKFSADQRAMLDMRLFILESFLDQGSAKAAVAGDDIFAAKPGSLTIVDLSDGFLDTPTACLLFDICFSIFEQHRPESGMVLALHEAHKVCFVTFDSQKHTHQFEPIMLCTKADIET